MKWDEEINLACTENNIRRVLACLNACKGITTESLESSVIPELLEALETYVEAISFDNALGMAYDAALAKKAWEKARAAITKAKGKKREQAA